MTTRSAAASGTTERRATHIDAGNDPVVPIAQGMALLVQAFGGDGCYPVFVRFEGARLAEVRIDFVDADEAEGDRASDEDGG